MLLNLVGSPDAPTEGTVVTGLSPAGLVLFTELFGNVAGGAVDRGIPGISYGTCMALAIAIQVALATAITSGVGLVDDVANWTFEKRLVAPTNRTAVFVGKTAAEVLRIAVQIAITETNRSHDTLLWISGR